MSVYRRIFQAFNKQWRRGLSNNYDAEEAIYYYGHRSWWVTLGYLLLGWLVIPLFYGLWLRFSLAICIYSDRIVVSRGFIGTSVKEIFIEDIRTINVEQRPLQRIFGYGTIMIGTSATADYEEIADRMPNPMEIKNLILRLRKTGPEPLQPIRRKTVPRHIYQSQPSKKRGRFTI